MFEWIRMDISAQVPQMRFLDNMHSLKTTFEKRSTMVIVTIIRFGVAVKNSLWKQSRGMIAPLFD